MRRRKRMKKVLLSLGLVLLVLGCASKPKEIAVGFIGPLTGDAANYGKLSLQAVQIALEEINSQGGIAGLPVKLYVEDDEGKPEKANAAFEKLYGVNKIYGFVGPMFSSCALAIAPKAQAAKVVMISQSATHKDVTSKGDFIFRNVLSDQLQAEVFGRYVAEKLGIKKVAILYIKNDYSQGLAMDFKRVYEASGGQVVAVETGVQGDKDFKTQLTKIKEANPEALYIPNYVAEMAQILEQAKQLGLKVKILSADGFSNPEIFALAKDLADGVIFSNSADESGIKNPLRDNFVKTYRQKYGEDPDAFAINAYDAFKVLLLAIKNAAEGSTDGKIDRTKIRDFLLNLQGYQGVSGTITFLPSGDAIKNVGIFVADAKNKTYKQTAVYKVENGKLVEVK